MANKYVVTTVQTIVRRYYVEVDNPDYALDGIICGELEEFSQQYGSEDPIDTYSVDQFPKAEWEHSVNGAVMTYNEAENRWDISAAWDLA